MTMSGWNNGRRSLGKKTCWVRVGMMGGLLLLWLSLPLLAFCVLSLSTAVYLSLTLSLRRSFFPMRVFYFPPAPVESTKHHAQAPSQAPTIPTKLCLHSTAVLTGETAFRPDLSKVRRYQIHSINA